MRTLILEHIASNPPRAYREALERRGHAVTTVRLHKLQPLPDWRGFDAIVAMGGAMSADDDATHPWLTAEKQLIHDAVRAGRPYWGVCLGAQLLAASLGARVYRCPVPERGIAPITLSLSADADPVFGRLPKTFDVFHWHADTFDLPAGAERLAGSEASANQAFRVGECAYGVQFHAEVTPADVEAWGRLSGTRASVDMTSGPGSFGRIIAELKGNHKGFNALAANLGELWVKRTESLPARNATGSHLAPVRTPEF